MKTSSGKRVTAAGILLMTGPPDSVEFLLMRHPTRWDLPKGHCDKGESFLETALRETEEETGISANAIRIDPKFRFDLFYQVQYSEMGSQWYEKQVRYFLGFLDQKPELILTEHSSACWHRWQPPHQIQAQTIDSLLESVAHHLDLG
ncbi:MAG: NUDIX domain-containing protein [Rubripirellula sp.]|nr:DNA mismatch repair protein MutT [Rhodopirellula sp.]MCH1440081.1 NUDIX domain-containing protein [Rubripirellula sp.]OUX08628.1 MAG: DNA mismatch repair protein MutT [Planctomycetaceae bacterium TMED240]